MSMPIRECLLRVISYQPAVCETGTRVCLLRVVSDLIAFEQSKIKRLVRFVPTAVMDSNPKDKPLSTLCRPWTCIVKSMCFTLGDTLNRYIEQLSIGSSGVYFR